jgi:hypothetical protein
MAATPKPAPDPAPATITAQDVAAMIAAAVAKAPPALPAAAPLTARQLEWWVPPWVSCLGAGLFAMTWWIMWTLAPAKGHDPSQLFNMLAQAIVLTGFIGSEKKNDTIAAQAATIAAQTQTSTPPQGA